MAFRNRGNYSFMFTGLVVRRTRAQGFTLIEITMAVAILGMMSLAIYRFVQSNLVAIRAATAVDAAEARYGGLHDLVLAQWQTLPPGAGALIGEPFKINDRSRDEIRWICGAGPGLLTRYASADYIVTLRLRRHSEKSDQLDLGLRRQPKNDTDSEEPNETWIPLIENVQSLQIRYFDPRINSWTDKWSDAVTLPRLVKLSIGRPDTSVPWEVIIPLTRTSL